MSAADPAVAGQPPVVVLRPMGAPYFDSWIDAAIAGYAAQIVDAGITGPDDALERGRKDFAELLPDGVTTAGHLLFTAFDVESADSVGSCWVQLDAAAPTPKAFIYSFDIDPDKQRRGFGRAMMTALIDVCRDRGAVAVSLNVFAGNDGARLLYEQAGFAVTSYSMKLSL